MRIHLPVDDGSPQSPFRHTESPPGTSPAPCHLNGAAGLESGASACAVHLRSTPVKSMLGWRRMELHHFNPYAVRAHSRRPVTDQTVISA
jgi:hypothetical protein